MDAIIPQKLYRLSEIIGNRYSTPPTQGLIPVARSTWYAGIKTGIFPQPIRISDRISVWLGQDLIETIESLTLPRLPADIRSSSEFIQDPVDWLWRFADWQVALTVTSQPFPNSKFASQLGFTKTLSCFVNCLNNELIGHGARRQGYTVGCAIAIEKNDLEGFHAHGVMTIPSHLEFGGFEQTFIRNVHRMKTLGKQMDIKHAPDSSWISYMLKTGASAVVPELLIKPSAPR